MNSLPQITTTVFATISLLSLSTISLNSASAQEPNNSSSPASTLGGTYSQSLKDMIWGIGGTYPQVTENSESTPNETQFYLQQEAIFDLDQNWTTTGDDKTNSAAIPLIDF